MNTLPETRSWVGPVLENGALGRSIVAALRELNPTLAVTDRGAYLRVLAPGTCVQRRDAVERHLGAPFHLPGDLEIVMPSFKGRLTMGEEDARWEFERGGAP